LEPVWGADVMASEFDTRHTLLQRASNVADEEAWSELVAVYERFIRRFLRHLTIPVEECADITQEVLVRLWRNLPAYERDRAKFRTWLITIIRNTASSYMGRLRRGRDRVVPVGDSRLLDVITDEARHDELAARYQGEWEDYIASMALDNIRKHFSGKAVEVFVRALNGASTGEIAAALGLQEQSVRNLKNRVKVMMIREIQRLRAELEP